MAFRIQRKDWLLPILLGISTAAIYLSLQFWPAEQTPIAAEVTKTSYADIIEPVLPFTVSILTNRVALEIDNALAQDPYFSKFIQPSHQKQTSLGSGIVLNMQGDVVTNAHVIKDAQQIILLTHSGDLAQVTDVLIDPDTDIAVLKTNLKLSQSPPVERASEDRVGDLVFTIGNPFGIGQSVSMGVISATGRQQPGLTELTDFIQTDAAINPGNSGGALINARGVIIGMNTAIFSSTGGSQGIGFAIPFSHVMTVSDELSKKGKITRGYFGIDVQTSSLEEPDITDQAPPYLEITSVALGSPAEKAKLSAGDLLLKVNGVAVGSRIQAARIISQIQPGEVTEVLVWRQGKLKSIFVTPAIKR